MIHKTATIDPGAVIGSNTSIWHYSHVMSKAKIGSNCILGQNVFVADGVVIGNNVKIQNNVSLYEGLTVEDDVFLGPSMVFTNVSIPRSHFIRKGKYELTLIKRGATIGANATVVCGHTVGEYAFIGAGAVITKDVIPYALMLGVPAKQKGWACWCGNPLKDKVIDLGYMKFEREENFVTTCLECKRRYNINDKIIKELK